MVGEAATAGLNRAWTGRTDERLAEEIGKLTPPEKRKHQTLGPARTAASIEAQTGIGKLNVADAGGDSDSTAAGITPPLTEPDVSAREYYDPQTLTSSDGLFTFEVRPIAKAVFMDAAGQRVELIYAEPLLP